MPTVHFLGGHIRKLCVMCYNLTVMLLLSGLGGVPLANTLHCVFMSAKAFCSWCKELFAQCYCYEQMFFIQIKGYHTAILLRLFLWCLCGHSHSYFIYTSPNISITSVHIQPVIPTKWLSTLIYIKPLHQIHYIKLHYIILYQSTKILLQQCRWRYID